MSSLYEDAQELAAQRAKRDEIVLSLKGASELADVAGLNTEGIYEALASGRERTDPDYWSFKIMQYLYEYMPFGKAGRWFVPIILGLGLYKAFELLRDVVKSGWSSLQASEFYQGLKKTFTFLPDQIVRDAAGNDSIDGFTDAAMLQAGLLAVLPPYAAVTVASVASKTSSSGANAEVAALKKRLADCEAALKERDARLASLAAGSYNYSLMPYTGIATGAPLPPQGGGNSGADLGDYAGQVAINKGLDWLFNGGLGDIFADRVVRDANAAGSLGLTSRSMKRLNY